MTALLVFHFSNRSLTATQAESKERLTALERHVQKRVRQLMKLTPVQEKRKKHSRQEQ